MQVFGTSETKSHIESITDDMNEQLPDKTDDGGVEQLCSLSMS